MPRVQVKEVGRRAFKDGESVIACEAAYVEVDGESFYISTGMRFRSDHPAVVAAPQAFMPSDTPADEVHLWLAEPVYTSGYEPNFHLPSSPPIAEEDALIVINGIGSTVRQLKIGNVVSIRDPQVRPIVKEWPSCFCWFRPLTEQDVESL